MLTIDRITWMAVGRNPATGEAIKIAAKPARKAIRLTALKILKMKI